MTPDGRLIKPIDEEGIDQGYDSDGGHAPWQDVEDVDPNAPELDEDSLPVQSVFDHLWRLIQSH